jgi:hypothetical protein
MKGQKVFRIKLYWKVYLDTLHGKLLGDVTCTVFVNQLSPNLRHVPIFCIYDSKNLRIHLNGFSLLFVFGFHI